nr:MAG TPA: hypothetical protein [Bacteriophage sp.]
MNCWNILIRTISSEILFFLNKRRSTTISKESRAKRPEAESILYLKG